MSTPIAFLIITCALLISVCSGDLCSFVDPIKSCECYYDGQHFSAQCIRTKLQAIPSTRDIPKDLERLDVSYNQIEKLEFDDPKYEGRLIRVFRAAFNSISALPKQFLNALPHLTTLDLSHNQITQLEADAFASVGSLHTLDLSFNSIQTLPDAVFAHARDLRYLDLSYNDIGQQLQRYTSLNSSGLGFNENMQTVRLNAINLTEVPNAYFENMSLVSVALADNAIVDVPLLPTTLIELDLSGNHFVSIAPRHLIYTQLKSLKLNRMNNLENIENYAFYNLISLEVLEIEHCPLLKTFNDMAFGVINGYDEYNLTRISLNGNSLRKLNETYFHMFNKIEQVDLSSNPWICDCNVIWFKWVKPKLINQRSMR